MGMTRLLTTLLILFVLPSSAVTQVTEIRKLPDHLIGTWIGTLADPKQPTRTMQIQEIKSAASGQKDVFEAKGLYGYTGKEMLPISITIASAEGKFQLSFLTPAKSEVLLTWATPTHMEGTFISVKGKEQPFLFRKNGQMPITDHSVDGRVAASTATTSNPKQPEKQPSKQPILRIETGVHTASIIGISSDSEDRFLVSSSHDRTARVWELPSVKLIQVLRPPMNPNNNEGSLVAVAMSPDGSVIACGGDTGKAWENSYSIYFFSRESGKMIRRLNGLPGTIRSLAYSKDGRYLAAALGKEGMKIFDSSTGKTVLDGVYGDSGNSVDFDYSGRLITSSSDGHLRLYEPSFRLIAKQQTSGGTAWNAKFSPDGKMIAVGYRNPTKVEIYSGDQLTYLFSLNTVGVLKSQSSQAFCVLSWSGDGKTLFASGTHETRLTGQYQRAIRSWPISNRFWYTDIPISANAPVSHMITLKDGRVAWITSDPYLGILDPIGGNSVSPVSSTASFVYMADDLSLSNDGLHVGFYYHQASRAPGSFSIDQRLLRTDIKDIPKYLFKKAVTSSEFISVKNWRFQYELQTPTLNGNPLNSAKGSNAVAIHPDGKRFVIGRRSVINLFDKDGKEIWKTAAPANVWGVNISGDGKLCVAALHDGTIRWYRMNDGKELLAFCPHSDKKRWVMWTPEGYFDASPGGAELIGYHINQRKDQEARFISMNNLYDVFYRPDIIQAKMRGNDIREMFTLSAEAALMYPPPTVKIADVPAQTDQKKIKVCYQVASSGGGIGEVRLFHNGKLIQSDGYYKKVAQSTAHKTQLAALNSRAIYEDMRSISIKGIEETIPSSSKPKGDTFDDCTEVEAVPGENEVSVAAFNSPNTVQSYMETATFNSKMKPEEPHLYILSIGIDQYKENSVNLKYAVKDAKDIEDKLRSQAATLYKPGNIHYTLLTDKDAVKTNIIAKINDLSQVIKPSDSFVLFVAGHGVLLQNQYHMLTHDYNGVVTDDSVISSNEIVDLSKKVKSLSQLLILDTCHAGGVDYLVSGLYDARMSVLAKKMGLHIYASASDKQSAMDGYKGNGLFTHTLLSGLNNKKEADLNNDGAISLVELGGYSKQATVDISKEIGHSQTPLIINFGRDNAIYKLQ